MPSSPGSPSKTLIHLSTFTPPSTSRAWQTAPHPHHPYIATAFADRTIRIYSLTSFTLLSTITGGHKRSVRCCSWKPSLPTSKSSTSESVLAAGSFDSNASIWVGRPGQEVVDAGFGEFSQEGRSGEVDDEEDFRFAVVLEGHDSEIKSVAWSVHGTFLATCSRDKSVWIWEPVDDDDNYETVAVMQEHDGDVKCVAWHPDEEQCLASGSYDDMIRVWRTDIDDEWGCVGVCEGHTGTVWCVEWEPPNTDTQQGQGEIEVKGEEDDEPISGPRLLSCSDDITIRLWRRKPKAKPQQQSGPRIPSIIRSTSDEEEWFEDGQLPQAHERAIYGVSWSRRTKRVVSCGSDGKLIVYEEAPGKDEDAVMTNGDTNGESASAASSRTWRVIAEVESAHGVFEVNHVCWARRFDRGRRHSEEEVIISTGDDGEVKCWILDNV